MDAKWEIGAVVAVGVGLALLHAWRAGHANGSTVIAGQKLALPPPDTVNDALSYQPDAQVDNGFSPTFTPEFSFPLFVTNTYPSFDVGPTVTGTPANVSSGTPQCGCANPQVDDFAALFAAQQNAINRTIDAMNALQIQPPVVPVYVTLTQWIKEAAPPVERALTAVRHYFAGTADVAYTTYERNDGRAIVTR